MDLQGKIAVVTGAASGIGRHTSIALAKGGADIALANLERDGLAAVLIDVTKLENVQNVYEHSISKMGQVDILMNNAGVHMTGPLEKTAIDDWKWDVFYGAYVFLLICWIVAAAISSTPLLLLGW